MAGDLNMGVGSQRRPKALGSRLRHSLRNSSLCRTPAGPHAAAQKEEIAFPRFGKRRMDSLCPGDLIRWFVTQIMDAAQRQGHRSKSTRHDYPLLAQRKQFTWYLQHVGVANRDQSLRQ